MFHRWVRPPVLKCYEESVFDPQFSGGSAAAFMKFLEGFLQDCQHCVKGGSFHAEKTFEESIAQGQGFLDTLGLDDHWLKTKK